MEIAVINQSKMSQGGGWSFIDNFYTGMISFSKEHSLTTNWQEADIILIPSASMIDKDLFRLIKGEGKKIVLRVDNIPRNSRNRNTGTSRLKMMSDESDLVIYQSQWAREYVGYFLQKSNNTIIYNGIDTSVYNPSGASKAFTGKPIYLYSRYSRDETKQWELAWYKYQLIQRKQPEAKLIICGRFSDEVRACNFDFYNNENIEYIGVIDTPKEMAQVYRGVDFLLATYSNDCYSNTYQESLACGVQLYEPDLSGGTPELMKNGVISCQDMVENYLKAFKKILQ